jgi:drug/metabolite transporter (DMT)-like permease
MRHFRNLSGRRLSARISASPARLRLFAEVGLALAGMIWGVNFTLVKAAVGQMPPVYYLGLRFAVAALIMIPFCVRRLRGLDRRGWMLGVGLGVLLFGGFVMQTVALKTVSPGISGFLTGVYVVLVPLIIGLVRRRWPSPLVWVGIAVVMSGMAALSLFGRMQFGTGEVITLVASLFWALHIVVVGYACTRYSVTSLVLLQMATCAVLSLITAFAWERPALFPGWEPMGVVIWTGIMGGVVAYWLMAFGQRHTPDTLATVFMNLEAVFALLSGIILGYDTLTLRNSVGFFLVFAGTIMARLGSHKNSEELPVEPAPPGP